MTDHDLSVDKERAIQLLMDFLSIEGITGQEKAIGQAVRQVLLDAGVPKKCIRFDKVNEQIPLPTQTGNLIVTLPGTESGPRQLFSTHLDTVPLCAGAVPVRKGTRIHSKGDTALGGDNRTGCACLVTMASLLMERNLPHPPTTLLFTVREESGLWGARFVDQKDLEEPQFGFNVDGGSPREITIGAVGAERWQVEIFGRAAHAGGHPERGVSATVVASIALSEIYAKGWFGKVRQNDKEGTSNVGSFGGKEGESAGQATNVVTDYVHIRGESRSHDKKFVSEITAAYREAFSNAAKQVADDRGRPAKVKFKSERDYYPFRLKENSPVIRTAQAAAERLGWEPTLKVTNGGLDANWIVRNGIPTITFGAGENHVHTVDEFVEIKDYHDGCRYALALATHTS